MTVFDGIIIDNGKKKRDVRSKMTMYALQKSILPLKGLYLDKRRV